MTGTAQSITPLLEQLPSDAVAAVAVAATVLDPIPSTPRPETNTQTPRTTPSTPKRKTKNEVGIPKSRLEGYLVRSLASHLPQSWEPPPLLGGVGDIRAHPSGEGIVRHACV